MEHAYNCDLTKTLIPKVRHIFRISYKDAGINYTTCIT